MFKSQKVSQTVCVGRIKAEIINRTIKFFLMESVSNNFFADNNDNRYLAFHKFFSKQSLLIPP